MAKNGNVVAMSVSEREAKAKAVWNDLVGDLHELIILFGGLLLIPVFAFVGLGYGLRIGIVTGMKKTTEMMTAWWGVE
jgi:hypothetical protein